MSMTNAFKQLLLSQVTTLYVSYHTGDPGLTGANEVSGAPYARQPITFSGSGASVSNDNNPETDFPNGTSATHIGLWSAAMGGTFYSSEDPADRVYLTGDKGKINTWTISLN